MATTATLLPSNDEPRTQSRAPSRTVPRDMWSACASGRWAYVVEELDKDASLVHKADLSGQTVLHWACLHGANVIAQRVLDMGSSVSEGHAALRSFGWTACADVHLCAARAHS